VQSASLSAQRYSIVMLRSSIQPTSRSCTQEATQRDSRLKPRSQPKNPIRQLRWLLRARRERPRDCRAAEKRDELAPLHSTTSLARASSDGGMSRPSAFAVLRLMMSSISTACWNGKSAGLVPLRISHVSSDKINATDQLVQYLILIQHFSTLPWL
jgi:hypothetical protein